MNIGTVQELWRYPVKSMGGESLAAAAIGSGGITNDRGWALQESATGKIASAKNPRAFRALLDFAGERQPARRRWQGRDGSLQHVGAGIAHLVDAMAEAHQGRTLAERIVEPRFGACGVADLVQHVEHRPRCAAMQRSLQGTQRREHR